MPAPAITPGSDEVAQFSIRQAIQVISELGSVDPTPPERFLGRSGVINSWTQLAGQTRYYVVFDDDGSSEYLFEHWLLPKP